MDQPARDPDSCPTRTEDHMNTTGRMRPDSQRGSECCFRDFRNLSGQVLPAPLRYPTGRLEDGPLAGTWSISLSDADVAVFEGHLARSLARVR